MKLLNEWKIPWTERKWLSIDLGWLEGFGFTRCSNCVIIHPIPFMSITIDW